MYFSRVYPHWFHRLVWLLWKTCGWNIGSDPKKMRIKMHLQFGSALAGGRQNNMPQLYAARKKHPQPKNPAWHHGTDWQIIFGFGKKNNVLWISILALSEFMICCLSILRVNNCETCRSSRVFLLRERNHSPNIKSSLQLSFRSERHLFDPPCGVYISESLSLKHDEKRGYRNWASLIQCTFSASKQPACQVFAAA